MRILVVDDSADTARMMKVLLRGEGHDVRTAHDGPEAIEAARDFRPEVVLLDLALPTMSGYEVAEALRRDPGAGRPRIVAVSGYDAGATASAFDAHLTKPVDHDALAKLLVTLSAATGELPGQDSNLEKQDQNLL